MTTSRRQPISVGVERRTHEVDDFHLELWRQSRVFHASSNVTAHPQRAMRGGICAARVLKRWRSTLQSPSTCLQHHVWVSDDQSASPLLPLSTIPPSPALSGMSRQIYRPLAKIDQCDVCEKKEKPMLCSSCYEVSHRSLTYGPLGVDRIALSESIAPVNVKNRIGKMVIRKGAVSPSIPPGFQMMS